jgi:hypothetical protein
MLRGVLATDEAMRVGVDLERAAAADAGAFAVGDTGDFEPGGLAALRQQHGVLHAQRPRMPQVEVGKLRGHQRGIGQSGGRIGLGMPRDGAGVLQRRSDRRGLQISRAGAALALTEIHGEAEAAITRVLDGFHLAHAHIDVESGLHAGADCGRTGASAARARDHLRGDGAKPVEFGGGVQIGIAGGDHGTGHG